MTYDQMCAGVEQTGKGAEPQPKKLIKDKYESKKKKKSFLIYFINCFEVGLRLLFAFES